MESQKKSNSNYLPYSPHTPEYYDDEVDLRELFRVLWKGKLIIIATTFVFAVGSVLYALNLPNIYRADALLAPAESASGSNLSQMAGQLGGLAALAGVNIGASESSQTELAVQVMRSRQFIEGFISKHDLLVPLMAARDWDLNNNKLILDDDVYDEKSNKWLREPKGLRGVEPTAQEAYETFRKDIFEISEDKKNGLYSVSVKHYSPYIAQQWVDWLVQDINNVMRERTIKEASKNLDYLNAQLEKTSITDMQSTFYKLIEEQTKSLMLAEVQEEFVFKVIDPAVLSELKHEPNRAFLCIAGTVFGMIFGIGILFVFTVLKSEEK
ncbi:MULTISPECIES: Wzz/FepE/Etk N-terminal domain-containing protein [Vibrio]|uniref:Wzz/FepE/Etk N-terminal domain-containing protein n=1 Tax=Vibrio TaxID=662 RepID=UPI001A8F100F|nr:MULTISPECIES: Wzz/FepE/Etk N-terminal domain-containing protein [Vibrio]MBO0243906.1 LPS O-antigen length regulator [Vibrio sp. Vb0592]MCR9730381.1 Wzz/FepE/Etk N-terminal domain-containing protein [Vibrio parahaemolyticus]MCR9751199.1 Wzz/FepE/Etk N-terminal domain-containing protein [Vibrio parahaemolyticus]MCR9784433.1 Wzz/FepE/Etk N-terminal domain-containing protein [Vibrio parahaemolyticus]MCR9862134.1 Wzz/FepE/Etk N-terminal domain-containing protein [Vibrio parahaemolyticus]